MKYQEVGVDYWKMLKSMGTYACLTLAGWIMLRLFSTIFMMPRRLRAQQNQIQLSLQEFQRRYPDMNFTEDDLKDAEKKLETEMNKIQNMKTDGTSAEPVKEVGEDDKKTK